MANTQLAPPLSHMQSYFMPQAKQRAKLTRLKALSFNEAAFPRKPVDLTFLWYDNRQGL